MVDMISLEQKKKRGLPPGILKEKPLFPEKILRIIKLRDEGMTLQKIGDEFNMTSAGVLHLYNRWVKWAREQQ